MKNTCYILWFRSALFYPQFIMKSIENLQILAILKNIIIDSDVCKMRMWYDVSDFILYYSIVHCAFEN